MPSAPSSRSPRVLLAPDSFKGTFSAAEVAAAIGEGLTAAGCRVDLCPVADGGEGTAEILAAQLGGERLIAAARDPLGRRIEAPWMSIGQTAVIDVAAASGLTLIETSERDPLVASTRGTGDLIVAALDAGARQIFLAAGGSATVDGGAGIIEVVTAAGGLNGRATLRVLCDVDTPFERAAAVYGPQKGATTPALVVELERRLERLAEGWPRDPRGMPMSGAAGGLAGGLWATLGAQLDNGAEEVLRAVGFKERAAAADAIVVGEGQLDEQTLNGKIAAAVVSHAPAPVHAVVGRTRLPAERARSLGLRSVQEASDIRALVHAGETLGRQLVANGQASGDPGSADCAAGRFDA
jgi:glycerate kinase